jgi:hypothetical protein
MGRCLFCGEVSNFIGQKCPSCTRAEQEHKRQRNLIREENWRQQASMRGKSASPSSEGCLKFVFGLVVVVVILMIFHAPTAWFAHKVYDIELFEAVWASIECAEGWYGATLLWVSAVAFILCIYWIVAKKAKPVIIVPVIILIGFTAWIVYSGLPDVKLAYDVSVEKEINRNASTKSDSAEFEKTNLLPDHSLQNLNEGQNVNSQSPAQQTALKSSSAQHETVPTSQPLLQDGLLPNIVDESERLNATTLESKNVPLPKPQTLAQHDQKVLANVNDPIQIESTDGKVIQAKILAVTKSTVLVRREDGEDFEIPLSKLSEASRRRIQDYQAAKHFRK